MSEKNLNNLEKIASETKQKLSQTINKDGTVARKRGPKPKAATTPEVLAPSSSGLKPTFKSIFSFSGNILAAQFQYNEFKTTNDENEMLSEQADHVVLEFIPMGPSGRWVKLGILITSILTIFGKKWFDYEIKKKELKVIKDNADKKEPTNNMVILGPND